MAETKKKTGNIFVWIVIGLLIVGLMGFGGVGLSGTVRSVGSVNDKPLGVQNYYNALSTEINSASETVGRRLSFAEAQQFGLDQVAMNRLVAQRVLDAEADRTGLSVGDERIRQTVLSIPAFRGVDGTFDREAYRLALSRSNLSEAEFETSLREDETRALFQGALIAGVTAPEDYASILLNFIEEQRSFTYTTLTRADLTTGVPVPTEEELRAYHQNTPEPFTQPEAKKIAYIWLTPDMILDDVEVDEAALRALYDERAETYKQPERRLVERLIFPDLAAAQAGIDAIEANTDTFDALVEAQGFSLEDVDMGDVSKADLDAAGDAVFASTQPGIVGPVETAFGPALFRINAILAASETSFEEARPDLQNELALDRARRIIDQSVEDIEDLLASGASLAEVAAETDMQLGELAYYPGVSDGPAAYSAFQLEAARVDEGDFAEIQGLDDGGIFALELQEIIPPTLRPYDDVAEDVAAAWEEAEVVASLTREAEAAQSRIADGEGFEAAGLTPTQDTLTRTNFVEGVGPALLARVFEMDPGQSDIVPSGESVTIVRLDAVIPADLTSESAEARAGFINASLTESLSQDIFDSLLGELQSQAEISLNQSAINSVHTNFQ